MHNNNGDFMYYINYFFLFALLGHLVESLIYANRASGVLLLWWTPVYGIGTVVILFINKFLDKFKINKWLRIILLFLMSAVSLCFIEALGGYLIKWIFDQELWNYTVHRFNIGRYTSLEMALFWGTSSIIFSYFIKPITEKIISKIPKYLTYILIIIFIIDIILSLIKKK